MRGGLHFIGEGGARILGGGENKAKAGEGYVASFLGLRWGEGNELDTQGEARERKSRVWALRLVFFYYVTR